MRRKILMVCLLALAGALAGWSQQVPQVLPGKLGVVLGPHEHARPAAATAIKVPDLTVDATHLGSPVALQTGWRVGVTSDPAAANSDFDDTKWAVRDAKPSIADVADEDNPAPRPGGPPSGKNGGGRPPEGHHRPWVWFRIHVRLAQGHGAVALLVELPVAQNTTVAPGAGVPGLDVFANGKQIFPDGPNGSATYKFAEISRIYNLNIPAEQTDVTVAIRTLYVPFGYTAYTSFFSRRSFSVGNPDDLQKAWDGWYLRSVMERLPRLVNAILFTVLALFLLALYYTQRGHREYLWLALHELLQAPIGFIDLQGSLALMDQYLYGALVLQLVAISAYFYFEFLVAFLALKRRWYIQALRFGAIILAGIGPMMLMLGSREWSFVALGVVVALGSLLWITCWTVFIFSTLIAATLRKNFEAGLLLIPLLLTIVGIVEPMLTGGVSYMMGHTYHSPLTIQAGPVPIHFASIADFVGLLAIVLIIFTRFLRIQHDRERAQSELAAARSVQELMIPQEKQATPGYEMDSVYNPAAEVGGDFFYVEPGADGGMLVVIGDVAGHGLKAAMNVSMLIGALRRISERRPAKVLEALNRVVDGNESLTTCQAMWFGVDGELVISSAGHLPPYLNSQEVAMPGGLPLGAVPENHYDEVRLYLHPGDRILLLSDGVVEARRPTGELFGFDRVHNLSNQSAFYIADAAKEFGQEDDITVLTVKRVAA